MKSFILFSIMVLSSISASAGFLGDAGSTGSLICDQIMNPNVNGRAVDTMTSMRMYLHFGTGNFVVKADRNNPPLFQGSGYLSSGHFDSDCSFVAATKCSDNGGQIQFETQLTGAPWPGSGGTFDINTKQLHMQAWVQSLFTNHKIYADVLLQCH